MLRSPNSSTADISGLPLHQPEQSHQSLVFHQSTKDFKNPNLNLSAQLSPVLSPDTIDSTKNTPTVSIIPIKQVFSNAYI